MWDREISTWHEGNIYMALLRLYTSVRQGNPTMTWGQYLHSFVKIVYKCETGKSQPDLRAIHDTRNIGYNTARGARS